MLLALAACGDDATDPVDANATPDADVRGTLSFNWSISDGSAAATCGEVGASAIAMTLLPIGVQGSDNEISSCATNADSGVFTTGPVVPRSYDLQITIAASQGDLIDEVITFSNIAVDPLDNTDLGDVEFTIDPLGNVEFQLAAIETGGNCALVVDDGAGIVDFELVLMQNATCVPVDFEIYNAAGDTLEDTYTVACTGDERYGSCIAEDKILRVTGIGSGPSEMDITGYRTGDLPCYVTTANFTVPGNDLTADLQAVNIPLDLTNKNCVPPKTP